MVTLLTDMPVELTTGNCGRNKGLLVVSELTAIKKTRRLINKHFIFDLKYYTQTLINEVCCPTVIQSQMFKGSKVRWFYLILIIESVLLLYKI